MEIRTNKGVFEIEHTDNEVCVMNEGCKVATYDDIAWWDKDALVERIDGDDNIRPSEQKQTPFDFSEMEGIMPAASKQKKKALKDAMAKLS